MKYFTPELIVMGQSDDDRALNEQERLWEEAGDRYVAYLDADLRDTAKILEHAAGVLDFSRPVAVMLVAVLHLIGPDDDPYGIVQQFMAEMAPGSYLLLSHVASDIEPEKMAEMGKRLNRLLAQKGWYRSQPEVAGFFAGLELVPPGIVAVQQWRPDSEMDAARRSAMWGGVAQKPG